MAVIFEDLDKLGRGDMAFDLEKCLKDRVPVFKLIDMLLLEKLLELLLFLVMNHFHHYLV